MASPAGRIAVLGGDVAGLVSGDHGTVRLATRPAGGACSGHGGV